MIKKKKKVKKKLTKEPERGECFPIKIRRCFTERQHPSLIFGSRTGTYISPQLSKEKKT